MPYFYYTTSSSDLQHYGVLGMHWGIRRYQPYSTTGPRKGGKTGREIGEAANSKSNKTSSKSGLTEGQKKALKYAAIGLGVAAAAGVGYMAWQKYGRNYVDMTIKGGKMLQTLSAEANRIDMGDSFYAAINKHDKTIYKARFGANAMTGGFKKAISVKTTDKLKIASSQSAGKVFRSMFDGNDDFKLQVQKIAFANSANAKYAKGIQDLMAGKFTPKAYDAFNMMLVGHGEAYDGVKEKFFNALKEAGYSGLLDVNDKSYSGFGAKAPVIIFDKSKVIADTITELNAEEVAKNVGKMALDQISDLGIGAATVGSAYGSMSLGKSWLDDILKDQDKKSA